MRYSPATYYPTDVAADQTSPGPPHLARGRLRVGRLDWSSCPRPASDGNMLQMVESMLMGRVAGLSGVDVLHALDVVSPSPGR